VDELAPVSDESDAGGRGRRGGSIDSRHGSDAELSSSGSELDEDEEEEEEAAAEGNSPEDDDKVCRCCTTLCSSLHPVCLPGSHLGPSSSIYSLCCSGLQRNYLLSAGWLKSFAADAGFLGIGRWCMSGCGMQCGCTRRRSLTRVRPDLASSAAAAVVCVAR
jgi:hypothetical protein